MRKAKMLEEGAGADEVEDLSIGKQIRLSIGKLCLWVVSVRVSC